MRLTDEEKRMLNGECGEPKRIAMEILTALGTIYGAEDMVPINSAHCAGLSFKSHGVAGTEWAEDMAAKGAKVVVPTSMNVVGVDRSRDLKLPAEWTEYQMRIEKAYEAMGCYGTSTCVPYYCGFLPKFGEHVAWAESSAVVFLNSVLGARDNREGGPSALAAALCGRTPRHGFHLDEGRRGDILFKVETKLNGIADYGAMGNFVGKMIGGKTPVFEGIATPTTEELVYLGAAMASAGGVGMFHAVGVTPEAPDVATAFGGKKYETVVIGDKEIQQGYDNMTSAKSKEVDYVAIGCPHCSIKQIAEVAGLLKGKKVHPNVMMWVHTNIATKAMAKQFGYLDDIENAGAVLTQDLCTILGNPEALGASTVATNSAKMAFYAPGSNGIDVWYGDVEKCVNAAVNGYWE